MVTEKKRRAESTADFFDVNCTRGTENGVFDLLAITSQAAVMF
jgi:hypothetical protein